MARLTTNHNECIILKQFTMKKPYEKLKLTQQQSIQLKV